MNLCCNRIADSNPCHVCRKILKQREPDLACIPRPIELQEAAFAFSTMACQMSDLRQYTRCSRINQCDIRRFLELCSDSKRRVVMEMILLFRRFHSLSPSLLVFFRPKEVEENWASPVRSYIFMLLHFLKQIAGKQEITAEFPRNPLKPLETSLAFIYIPPKKLRF